MILTRKNALGGRPLRGFPLVMEEGMLGYKTTYCKGCNEPLVMRTIDVEDLLRAFNYSVQRDSKFLARLKERLLSKF